MPYTQCLEREVEADCKNEFCFRPFTLETKELIESYTKPWQMDWTLKVCLFISGRLSLKKVLMWIIGKLSWMQRTI